MPEGEVTSFEEDRNAVEQPEIPVFYDGTAGQVARIAVAQGALTLLTLGVYRFWAKTRLRRYFWNHVSIGGDRLEYTGLGKELFIGFLLAILVLVPLFAIGQVLEYALGESSPLVGIWDLVVVLLIWFLINFAIYRARRYRLSRTRWRGIRFSQTGSATSYALRAMAWQLFVGVTLGLAWPFYRVAMQNHRISNTWFGSERFQFYGTGAELFGSWVVGALLALPSLGVSYIWYRVKEFNYLTSQITAPGFRCRAEMRAGRLITLLLPYLLAVLAVLALVALAMGFLIPSLFSLSSDGSGTSVGFSLAAVHWWIVLGMVVVLLTRGTFAAVFFYHPVLWAICESTTLFGGEELEAVLQRADSGVTHGEGLADALDVGSI